MLKQVNIKLTTHHHQFFDDYADRLILTVSPQPKSADLKQHSNIVSSLLFQMAYEYAERGLTPLLICLKSEIQENPPTRVTMNPENNSSVPSSSNMSWSPLILNRIQIKYVDTTHDIKILMASIHAFRPSIDGLFFLNLHRIVDPKNILSPQDPILFDNAVQVIRFIDDATQYIKYNPTCLPKNLLNSDMIVRTDSNHSSNEIRTLSSSSSSSLSSSSSVKAIDNHDVEVERLDKLRLVIASDTSNATFNHLLKQVSQKATLLLSENLSNNKSSSRYIDPSPHISPTFSLHLRFPGVNDNIGNKDYSFVAVYEDIKVSTFSNSIVLN